MILFASGGLVTCGSKSAEQPEAGADGDGYRSAEAGGTDCENGSGDDEGGLVDREDDDCCGEAAPAGAPSCPGTFRPATARVGHFAVKPAASGRGASHFGTFPGPGGW